MKLKMLHAVGIVLALATSSVQATAFLPYGPDSDPEAFYVIGDYISFGGTDRNLTEATFLLQSNLSDPAPLGLELIIYNTDGDELGASSTTSGSWSDSGPFSYSFLFNNLIVPDEIVYGLSLTNDPTTDPVQAGNLEIGLTSAGPSIGQDSAGTNLLSNLLGAGLDLGAGEVIGSTNNLVTQAVSFNQGADQLGIVSTFSAQDSAIYQSEPDQAIPEPATLALLSLGLVGLGYAGRRKAS